MRRNQCRQCINLKAKERYSTKKRLTAKLYKEANREELTKKEVLRQNRHKLMAVEYKGGKCFDCQQEFHPAVYDFHHLDPNEKDRTYGQLMSRSFENIKKEIDKCVLLCANCHRMRHWGG